MEHIDNAVRVDDDEIDSIDGVTYRWHGEPFTGVGYEIRADGSFWDEITYENGKKEGPSRDWHVSGHLASEVFYRNGTPCGPDREWDESGQLRRETFREYGFRVREKKWNEAGRLIEDYEMGPDASSYDLLQKFRAAYDK